MSAVAERFWKRVAKTPDCWLWLGPSFLTRHGIKRGVCHWEGQSRSASRVAWQLENGPIPTGLFVCHHCDNPMCVRLDHLFLGTPRDNVYDMIRKGRRAPAIPQPRSGEEHSHAKLTSAEVLNILPRLTTEESDRSIGRSYGVSGSTIRQIRLGLTWWRLTGISMRDPAGECSSCGRRTGNLPRHLKTCHPAATTAGLEGG